MGNLLCGSRKLRKSESTSAAAGRGGSGGSVIRGPPQRSLSSSSYVVDHPFDKLSRRNPSFDYSNSEPKSTAANRPGGVSSFGSSGRDRRKMYGYTPDNFASSGSSGCDRKKKYGYIPDNFTSIDQVTVALRESGLESSNLILGIDFTKSNEWTGKVSFKNRSLHTIGDTPNPYEKAISIIGKTLAPFDEDNLIPCFGFGDATTHDQEVFSFLNNNSPCHGFEEVLACYKRIAPNLLLSGPTSYGPVVDAAVDIVERSGGQYHVLVIIADGQVTRSVNTNDAELSPQEEKTIGSIVNASSISDVDAFPGPVLPDIIRYNIRSFPKKTIFNSFYPLSIVLVGVGDGPWEEMKKFDDKIPAREFDNFQFVNFTAIMSKDTLSSEKETAFALAALMEIPIQYNATKEFGLLGKVTGKAKKIVPRHPPVQFSRQGGLPAREPSNASSSMQDDQNQACPVCLSNGKDMAFGCGHMSCRDCSSRLSECPICRQPIRSRLRLYT